MNLEDYDSALTAFEKGASFRRQVCIRMRTEKSRRQDYTAVIQEMQFNRIVCFEKKTGLGEVAKSGDGNISDTLSG